MKFRTFFLCSLIISATLNANDGLNSEMSHFVGGAVMAGGISALSDHYYPEYRADRGMIGFGISSLVIAAEQGVEYLQHGDGKGQMLDAVSHIAGSALGAWITDRYILSPVIQNSTTQGKYVGLVFQYPL
ncbi:MAG: hypothetical protein PHO27_03675 [Sulfuricurvum sp.]|nr:hypothetical protein [Sulfuricurvum sp.]